MTSKTFRLFRTESSGFKLSVLSAGHFFTDLYASFLPTFIPSLISRLGLTMAQAGFFSTFLGAIHIIFQPVIGYLSDRSANPWLVIWGPILTCFGATMIPPVSHLRHCSLLRRAVGTGERHVPPPGARRVGHVVPRDRLTVSLALFSVAGTAGVTVSPLFAVALMNTVGLKFMPAAAIIPVLVLGLFTWRTMPSVSHESGDAMTPQKGLLSTMKPFSQSFTPSGPCPP
jgi:Major Facilitator Superfamily.